MYALSENLQSQVVCDEAINTARRWARRLNRSVVVVDYGERIYYRVTRNGRIRYAPRKWRPEEWANK